MIHGHLHTIWSCYICFDQALLLWSTSVQKQSTNKLVLTEFLLYFVPVIKSSWSCMHAWLALTFHWMTLVKIVQSNNNGQEETWDFRRHFSWFLFTNHYSGPYYSVSFLNAAYLYIISIVWILTIIYHNAMALMVPWISAGKRYFLITICNILSITFLGHGWQWECLIRYTIFPKSLFVFELYQF